MKYETMSAIEKTHTLAVAGVSAATIWNLWTDINHWHTWDSDIEWAHHDGEFGNGSTFELKPKGGPKVKIFLSNVVPGHMFTDCAHFPFAKMYSIHKLTSRNGVLELSHTVRVTGALRKLWWHLVAKKVAAGLEEQTQNLIARARQLDS